MKTLKKLIVCTACMASLTAVSLLAAPPTSSSSSGGFLLGAPGVVTGSIVETASPFSVTKDLGRFYKYVYRGMETKGASSVGTGYSGNDKTGNLNLFTAVTGSKTGIVRFKEVGFAHEKAYNTSSVQTFPMEPAVTYNQENIIVSWKGNGSSKSPNGYFVIMGEGIKDPKEPKGTLGVKEFALKGTTFKLTWSVTRDY